MSKFVRRHGSEDMDLEDKQRVGAIMKKLGATEITYNNFLTEDYDGNFEFSDSILAEDVNKTYEFHRPDVVAWGMAKAALNEAVIVEIDGAVHNGSKKDQKRNAFYERSGTPFIILNKADLKEIGTTWDQYLTDCVRSLEASP